MSSNENQIKEIVELILGAMSHTDKAARNSTEKKLAKIREANLGHHFGLIILALKDESLTKCNSIIYSVDVKLSLIIYMKNILKSRIELKLIEKGLILEILKNMIELLLSVQLSENCLKNIVPMMRDLFSSPEVYKDGKIVFTLVNVVNEVVSIFANYSKNLKSIYFVKPLYTLIETLLQSNSLNEKNNQDVFRVVLEISHHILSSLIKELNNIKPKENLTAFFAL